MHYEDTPMLDCSSYPEYRLGMQPDDSWKDPALVLSYILGRKLGLDELLDAFEEKRSTYYAKREKGELITADSLIKAARNLKVNPLDLLIRYNLVTSEEIVGAAAAAVAAVATEEVGPLLGKSLMTGERRMPAGRVARILGLDIPLKPQDDIPGLDRR